MNKLKQSSVEDAGCLNGDALFNKAFKAWQHNKHVSAEFLFRHLASCDHKRAKLALKFGMRAGDFMTSNQRLRKITTDFLTAFVTLEPSENEIERLEEVLKKYLIEHANTDLLNIEETIEAANLCKKISVKDDVVQPCKILLVEDNKICQKIVRNLLTARKYHVDIAATGGEAIIMFESYDYSAIFMDLGLPDLSGCQVTKIMREIEDGHEKYTPIISYTTHDDMKDECVAAGMNDFLNKPFKVEELDAILRKWIPEID